LAVATCVIDSASARKKGMSKTGNSTVPRTSQMASAIHASCATAMPSNQTSGTA
jgi:hypothetical protein